MHERKAAASDGDVKLTRLDCNPNQNIRDSIRLHSIQGMQLLLLQTPANMKKESKREKGDADASISVCIFFYSDRLTDALRF